jgi:hypothetical protein
MPQEHWPINIRILLLEPGHAQSNVIATYVNDDIIDRLRALDPIPVAHVHHHAHNRDCTK